MKIIPEVVDRQDVCCLPPTATASAAAQMMVSRNISAIMVVEDGQLVGIVTERDMTRKCVANDAVASAVKLTEIMTRSPDTVAPDDDAGDALVLMELRGYRHLPVVDAGRIVGIVSIRDLYAVLKGRLQRHKDLSQRILLDNRYEQLSEWQD